MTVLILVVLVFLGICLHEAGHVLAMRSRKVQIEEVGFGFGPALFSFRSDRWLPGTKLFLKLFPVGAYVRPTDGEYERMLSLPIKDQALIYGAGIMANIFFGAFLLALSLILPPHHNLTARMVVGLGAVFVSLVIWRLRYFFCAVGIPLLGLVIAPIFFWQFWKEPVKNFGVGATDVLSDIGSMANSNVEALIVSAAISIILGIIQAMPVMPLDGGRVVLAWINRVAPQKDGVVGTLKLVWMLSGVIVIIALSVLPILVDLGKLALRLF